MSWSENQDKQIIFNVIEQGERAASVSRCVARRYI